MTEWTIVQNTAMTAIILGREYYIYRSILPKGIKYTAWCDMRAGDFAHSEPINPNDKHARFKALEDLKSACEIDAENWGVGRENWGVVA